jgi:hypothetical protein
VISIRPIHKPADQVAKVGRRSNQARRDLVPRTGVTETRREQVHDHCRAGAFLGAPLMMRKLVLGNRHRAGDAFEKLVRLGHKVRAVQVAQ